MYYYHSVLKLSKKFFYSAAAGRVHLIGCPIPLTNHCDMLFFGWENNGTVVQWNPSIPDTLGTSKVYRLWGYPHFKGILELKRHFWEFCERECPE